METESGLLWHFFLVGCLPFFLVGFGVFGFLRVIFQKFNLDNEDSVGKEFEPRSSFYSLTDEALAEIEKNRGAIAYSGGENAQNRLSNN
jgi:hypothetical protein